MTNLFVLEPWVEATIDLVPVAISVVDRDLRHVRVNARLAAFRGMTPEDFLGRTVSESNGPGFESIEAVLRRVLETGEPAMGATFAWQEQSRTWQYDSHPVRDAAGNVVAVMSFVTEITDRLTHDAERERARVELERRVAERTEALQLAIEELARSRIQLEEAQTIAQVGSWEANLLTGESVWSREAVRMFGADPSAPPSFELFLSCVHPDDRAHVIATATRVMETGAPADFEHRALLPSGQVRTLVSRNRAIKDSTGRVVRLIGTNQDITERREMEARLAVQDRMSSLGCLAAGLAHEINNPLSYVLGNADLALEGIAELKHELGRTPMLQSRRDGLNKSLDMLAELIGESRIGGSRVRSIVRDMKTFARGGELDVKVPVDLQSVADSTANLAGNEIRHRAQLVRDFGPVPAVLGSASRIGEVVLNLLINAAQAIPDGAPDLHTVAISTRTDALGNAILTVTDTGCGMSPDIMKRIFDPFFTTKPVGTGTGLGLAICHSIVESLGGALQVESQVGKGTTFRLVLPPTTVAPSQAAAREQPAVRRSRVLVVDDEPLVLAFARRCLAEHDVTSEVSATEALSRIDAGDAFDLILCDVMMPTLSGVDFFQKVSSAHPDVAKRIVFMTGGTFTERAQRFLDGVDNLCIEKPFDPPQLRALVRHRAPLGPR